MTRLRKVAVKIADTVVRRSRPDYRDWAEATARELEFIESDWAALRWALGSWKLAASCQNAPLTSLCEVPRAARNLLRETRVSTVFTWFSLLWTSYWFSGAFRNSANVQRSGVGWALLAASLVYIACEAVTFQGWRTPQGRGVAETAQAYRSMMAHQRDLLRGMWYWPRAVLITAGPLLGAYHAWLLKPGAVRGTLLGSNLLACGVIVLSLALTRPVRRRRAEQYQDTMDRLDALSGE